MQHSLALSAPLPAIDASPFGLAAAGAGGASYGARAGSVASAASAASLAMSMGSVCSGAGAGSAGGHSLGGLSAAGAGSAPAQQAYFIPRSSSLYVKNLPPEADKCFLYERFAPFGAIMSVKVRGEGAERRAQRAQRAQREGVAPPTCHCTARVRAVPGGWRPCGSAAR